MLVDTKEVLKDFQEKHSQANFTIKEKEFIISNLLQSEKSLVEQAADLLSELEIVAQDVDGLFAKIDMKNKIESGNQNLVQTFQSQRSQHLDVLHRSVSDSVSQQQQQLRSMEEQLQLFVSTKKQVTEGLTERVEKLKTTYSSGIKDLHNLAHPLDEMSLSSFEKLNLTMSKPSSALDDVLAIVVSNADAMLCEMRGMAKSLELE